MKNIICAGLLLLAAATIATAAPAYSATYVEGTAYAGGGSGWKALSVGDSVAPDASLRLDAGAKVEIKGMGTSFYLMQKGIYAIRELLAARQKAGPASVGAALASKMNNLLNGPSGTQSTVAGVRGADQSKSDDSAWVESGAQEGIARAKDYIQAGRYDEAIKKLEATLDEALDEELPELHYYLAYAYSLGGDAMNASRHLAAARPAAGAAWAGDYALLEAKLYLDAFAYAQAIDVLNLPGNDLSGDSRRAPLFYFLLGLGYRGSGDVVNEKASFAKLTKISGDSDLGKAAAQLLQNP